MLLDTPEHLETLAARPELWPNAVEEILRLESPVQLSARIATQGHRRGRHPSSGATRLVILHLAGANRDPKVFADPHRFDIERDNAGRHLSFSGGRHFCLGAALARAEGEVGLRTFFERFPDARLAGDGSRRDTRVLRGWSSLPITLGKARTAVEFVTWISALRCIDETAAFGELIRSADPSTPVPTCPDWTLKQLFRHVGRGNRWAAQIIADRRDETLDPREVRDGKPPDDPDAAIDWLNDGAQLIIDAVDRVGADTRGVDVHRRAARAVGGSAGALHEATVHRADAAIALGADYELSPELAADGISEWLERVGVEARSQSVAAGAGADAASARHRRRPRSDRGVDDHQRRRTASRGRTTTARAMSRCAARAKDLLLAIVRRRTAADGGVEVFGDTAVWDGWLERTPF